jgi:RimJ/RimL family protein N-acetyltransferase
MFRNACVCSAPADVVRLADGTAITLRPVGPTDRSALAGLFARLGPESRRARFLLPKHELSARELTYFTDIDHHHHESIAAVDRRDQSFIGVARYVTVHGRVGVAEVAIEIADTFQRRGIGMALASVAIQRAHVNGLALLTATTRSDNHGARAVATPRIFRPAHPQRRNRPRAEARRPRAGDEQGADPGPGT